MNSNSPADRPTDPGQWLRPLNASTAHYYDDRATSFTAACGDAASAATTRLAGAGHCAACAATLQPAVPTPGGQWLRPLYTVVQHYFPQYEITRVTICGQAPGHSRVVPAAGTFCGVTVNTCHSCTEMLRVLAGGDK